MWRDVGSPALEGSLKSTTPFPLKLIDTVLDASERQMRARASVVGPPRNLYCSIARKMLSGLMFR
jgi:hypothetical protein